jgi:DNA repair protein RadC
MNNNKNHHKGHRQRVLNKFSPSMELKAVEIVELCLFFSIPRKNVKPMAHALIKKYKYLHNILGAEKEDMLCIEGIGPQTYVFFQLILGILQYIQKEKIYDKERFFNMEEVLAYCKWKMCHLTHEEVRVLYFNSKNQLIKDEIQSVGSINSVAIYPREIIKKCLHLGATGIVLCHNHPSGDSTPSKEDIAVTLELQKITSLLQILLHDHIIIGDNNYFSMKHHNLI